jgi:hypothetical protein
MRLALIAYFDIGKSFGLGDSVFPESQLAPEIDIGLIGIRNPLGRGVLLNFAGNASPLRQQWRQAAAEQVRRPEMETGWSPELGLSKEAFAEMLINYVRTHPIARCELTVFAIGLVFVRLEFESGLPLIYMNGVSRCFEFAAYTRPIASALHEAAEGRVQKVLGGRRTGLEALSERKLPSPMPDARYEELPLITSFTDVIMCTDYGDDVSIMPALKIFEITKKEAKADGAADLSTAKDKYEPIRFEYHGLLYYSWPACLLRPNSWDNADYPPDDQILRMFECIKIAHVFLGTLEGFERLFQDEIRDQVDGYIRHEAGGRDPQELNRLRTLALAVVNLTNFNLVTPTDEDHAYFIRFDEGAHIDQRKELIINACETLYNVQVAETQDESARRQNVLNTIVFLLATLTLVSVSADAYNFVKEDTRIFEDIFTRLQLLLEFILALALLAAFAIFLSRPRRRKLRRKVRERSS